MTVVETLLVFVGAPLAVVVLLALLVYLPGGRKRTRYRPGQPWDHEPVWYEPHPEHSPAHGAEHALGGAHDGDTAAIGSSVYPERPAIASGVPSEGAHGTASGAPQPVRVGPLGGARGTW